MNRLEKFKSIISNLMRNDRNATYNEILKDNNNNIVSAIDELRECLNNVISDLDESENGFYIMQLEMLNNI